MKALEGKRWALFILISLAVLCFSAPLFILDHSPHANSMDLDATLLSPGSESARGTHWLGTDKFGRDFLSRVLLGGRISLGVGTIAVAISLLIGIPIGAAAGYLGGKWDAALTWFMSVLWSIPTLLLVIALTFILGKGTAQVFIAVGLTMWVEVARVVRGQILSEKEKEYAQAAKVLGYSRWNILFTELLPNVLGPVAIISATNFASAILIESGLSFLGIGTQPPAPSWGSMIKTYYPYLISGKPFLALIPGVLIALSVISLTALGQIRRTN